jgi:hypothetical protein
MLFLNTASRDRERHRLDYYLKHMSDTSPAPVAPVRPTEPRNVSPPPASSKPAPSRTG